MGQSLNRLDSVVPQIDEPELRKSNMANLLEDVNLVVISFSEWVTKETFFRIPLDNVWANFLHIFLHPFLVA